MPATPRRRYAPRLPPAERREQLLDTALAIALDRGFHAVTIDGVEKAAGVTRPVVYGAFADLTALLTALIDRAEARALEQLGRALPTLPEPGATLDPDEVLVTGVTAFLTAVREDPTTWRVILLTPEGAPGELHQRITEQRRAVLRQLRALVQWGLATKGAAAEVDVDLFARSVVTLAEGAARLMLADPERFPVERFSAFTRSLLPALESPPRRPARRRSSASS